MPEKDASLAYSESELDQLGSIEQLAPLLLATLVTLITLLMPSSPATPHGLLLLNWNTTQSVTPAPLSHSHPPRLEIPLPPPNSPLSTLKSTIYNLTGVLPAYQKLIFHGAVLKDELTTLQSFGIVDSEQPELNKDKKGTGFWDSWAFGGGRGKKESGIKMVLIGSKEVSARVIEAEQRLLGRKVPEETRKEVILKTEGDILGEIGEVVEREKLDSAEKELEGIERWIAFDPVATASVEGEEEIAPPTAPLPRQTIFLSELLIQTLLALDSFAIEPDWTEARKARKEGVRRVQGLLDRVDRCKDGLRGKL